MATLVVSEIQFGPDNLHCNNDSEAFEFELLLNNVKNFVFNMQVSKKLCRVCLKEDRSKKRMHPLFDKTNKCTEIVRRIEECFCIVLKVDEKFPKKLCRKCMKFLDISYKFRVMCQESESNLLEIIKKSELKSEPHETSLSNSEIPKGNGDNEEDEIFLEYCDFEEVRDTSLFDIIEETGDNDGDFLTTDELDVDEIDGKENIEDSDYSEIETNKIIDDDEFKPIPKKKRKKEVTIPNKKLKKDNKTGINETHHEKKKGGGKGRRNNVLEPKTHICEICGNVYARRCLLNMHMKRHRDEKPFACEICGKRFTSPWEIGRHIRKHTGEKPFECRFCGRTFSDRTTNKKHERTHTNERPFTCTTCGKSFSYSHVLKYHMLVHTGEKPFPCLPCNKNFVRKHQYTNHLATITHKQTVKNNLLNQKNTANHSMEQATVDVVATASIAVQ